jgi:UDP-glucose 4-epimerase
VLLGRGHEVTVLDNLVKGHRESVREGAELVVGELGDGALVRALLQRKRIEAVVHMAAHSMVGESVTQPLKYFENNVGVGITLLEAMKDVGVEKLVFSSTAATYGEPERQPISEGDPTVPTNPYGESKLAFEKILHWCAKAYGLKAISLRYFNAAGASEHCGELHDPETHLVPLVLQVAAGQRKSITVFGTDYPTPDGTCVRDYIHVLDLAEAHVLALEALGKQQGGGARAYNLGGSSQGHSVKAVIRACERVTGKKIAVELGARRPGDPAVLVAGSTLCREELGFTPKFQDLEQIIESAWKWMLKNGAQR